MNYSFEGFFETYSYRRDTKHVEIEDMKPAIANALAAIGEGGAFLSDVFGIESRKPTSVADAGADRGLNEVEAEEYYADALRQLMRRGRS